MKGQPFTLDDWQEKFIREAFAKDVIEAGVSLARKNGKTGLIAAAVLWFLLNREDWNYSITSEDGKFAVRMRQSIYNTARASGFGEVVEELKSPHPGRIRHQENRNEGNHLPGNKGISGQGEDVDLAIVDEAGLLKEGSRELWNSQQSSISARDGLFLSLGTQKTGPMFREQRERAHLQGRVFHIYETPDVFDIDDPEGWKLSNPSLGTIKSERSMRGLAEKALASPADQNDFRSDDLNQPVEAHAEYILDLADSERMMKRAPVERFGPCVLGIDLGGSTSMSAISAFWPYVQRLEIYGCFPRLPNLQQREKRDAAKAVYLKAHTEGDLIIRGEHESNVPEFLTHTLEQLQGQHIIIAGFDRFRVSAMKEALHLSQVRLPVVVRGTGGNAISDAADDIRAFQHFAREGNLNIGRGRGLLVNALRNTRLSFDGHQNPSITKDSDNHRTDPVSASVIACGLGRPYAKIHQSPGAQQADNEPACVVVGNSE